MQHDLAVAIAVKVLDSYYPSGDYSSVELLALAELISGVIKEQENKTGSHNFLD
jgi:hypothetical protein